jgi:hypothetical protein
LKEEESEMKKFIVLLVAFVAVPAFALNIVLDYTDVVADGHTPYCRGSTDMTSNDMHITHSAWWAFEMLMVRFDISDIASLTSVPYAELRLYTVSGSPTTGINNVTLIQGPTSYDPYANNWDETATAGAYYTVGGTGPMWSGDNGAGWTETGAMWASRSRTVAGSTCAQVPTGQDMVADVTQMVNAWLGGHAANGMYVHQFTSIGGCPGGGVNGGQTFGTREAAAAAGDASVGPRLVILPEPATMLLLLAGAATLIRRKR